MPTFDEREHLVREFCRNTGASDRQARELLNRFKWDLPKCYREAEQICINDSKRASGAPLPSAAPFPTNAHARPPPPSYSNVMPPGHTATSRGGMEGGVGPAVTLDTRGVRPADRSSALVNPGQQMHPAQGLQVDLPPVRAPVERIIPIQVEGVRTTGYQHQPASSPNMSMARVTLDDKVLPSQPGMVAPKMNTSNTSESCVDHPPPVQPPSSQLPESYPRLKRGFSNIMENEPLVNAARTSVLQEIAEDNHHSMFMTFVLPDLTIYPEDFQVFLRKELIESSTLHSLQSAGRLNWWADLGLCQRLIPMATSGDGNCLLHAASLAMWGIHDRLLTLRNALHDTLTKAPYKNNLYRRWRWQQTHINQQSALVFSEAEWKTEWENILRLASPSPRSGPDHSTNSYSCCDSALTSSPAVPADPVVYESLEEFHVFVLAHVLQRPIIVVADTILRDANGEALAPIPFGGIYLPLECSSAQCCPSPLLLTYDAAHFSALVPMQHSDPTAGHDPSVPLAIPVVDPHLSLLPLHFCHDPGERFDWNTLNNKVDSNAEPCLEDRVNLLKIYMDVVQLPLSSEAPIIRFPSRQSSAGSTGSDDSGGFNSGSTQKDNKKKEGKQNIMAKQFGSLGKSMGKKLKNLGNNLTPSTKLGNKVDGGGGKDHNSTLTSGLNQSAKLVTALAGGVGENDDTVYCAKLSCEYMDTREVFISNYLKDAEARFVKEQASRRLRGGEEVSRQQQRISPYATSSSRACRTPGCLFAALPDVSLCDRCASQQTWRQGTLDRVKGQSSQQPGGYNTFPGRHKLPTGLPSSSSGGVAPVPAAPDSEIYKCGKSKFYASSQTQPSADPFIYPAPHSLQVLRQADRQQSLSTGNVGDHPHAHPATHRPRSPSPDYDQSHSREANPKCATPGCDFYGSEERGNLCSGCYRNLPQQPLLAKPEKTTRL